MYVITPQHATVFGQVPLQNAGNAGFQGLQTSSLIDNSFRTASNPGTRCRGLVCCEGPDCDFDAMLFNLTYIIKKVLELAFVFIAVMFAYAGFKYMTSHGDTGEISAAHSMFQKAVIGMIITLCSFLIIELITSSLGLDENIIKLVK